MQLRSYPAKVVEKVYHIARIAGLELQASEQIYLRLIRRRVERCAGRRLLSQEFAELTKFHQRCDGIVGEVVLGQHGCMHEDRLVRFEEVEIS